MRLLTILPASGKAGGIVASHSRNGTRYSARTARRQPRTPSQQANRAITGALAQAWRSLAPCEQQAWDAIATGPASGFNLFTLCNSRLQAIGLYTLLRTPQPRPAFPPITSFTATCIYTSPAPPNSLIVFQLDTTPAIPPTFGALLRATQVLSQAKGNIRGSDLRTIEATRSFPTPNSVPPDGWVTAWGNGPSTGQVTFELILVDPLSGWASTRMRASTPYAATSAPAPPTSAVILEQDSSAIASVSGQIFEQDGTAIAGN